MIGRMLVMSPSLLALTVGPPAAAGEPEPARGPTTVAEHRAAAKSYQDKKFVEQANALAATATVLSGYHDKKTEELTNGGRAPAPRP